MTLAPQFSDTYYVDNDTDILKLMDYTYSKYITINQSFWAEANIDSAFKAGDQTLWNDIYGGNVPAYRRKQFNFNRIRRVVNMISGYQRQHRKSINVSPVEGSDDKTADQFSKLMYHVNNTAGVLDMISEAFEGAVTAGMNLLSTWVDYRNDPVNGDIKVDNLHYSSYLIDPYFKKMDLSDCNSLWTRRYYTKKQVSTILPGRDDELKDMRNWGSKDGKFQYMPEAYSYAQDLVTYDEFWYLDSRKQKMLIDTVTGECKEWRGHDDDLQDFLSSFPQVVEINQEIPTVKLAIVVQGKVMYNGPNPMGIDKYPFTPVWCYYEPHLIYFPIRVQGVVRGLRDAQYLYNRRRVIELDILESQITSGYIYKENALVNPKDAFLQGQGKGLALKAEAQMTDVLPIQPPQIPPSMIQLSELLGQEIQQISGVNEELLGSADDDKAGILSMLRQGAGLTTLQPIFDHLDQSQKLLGELHMDIIQANWTPGKVQRIIAEEPTDQFYNRAFGKYDCVVEEAPVTATQKQLALQKALYLREIGVPITTEYLIENANLPDKDKLIETITKQEQQQAEQQQKMEQLQMQQLQVENETKLAYAEAQHSLAAERMNKVQLDAALSAERLQRADEDRTGTVLNLVKAIKEIEDMDFDKLERSLRLVHEIESSQAQNKQEVVA